MKGRVAVESLSWGGSTGSHHRLEIEGPAAVSILRRLRLKDGTPLPDGEAEVNSLALPDALDAILRHVPVRFDFVGRAREEVRIPWEAAAAIAQDPESATASYVRSVLGWNEVPGVLASLLQGITSEATIAVFGPAGTTVRRWISCDTGWVSLALERGDVVLVPCTSGDIAHLLTHDLAMAVVHG